MTTKLQLQCAERKYQRLIGKERDRLEENLRKVTKEKAALKRMLTEVKKKADKNQLRAIASNIHRKG